MPMTGSTSHVPAVSASSNAAGTCTSSSLANAKMIVCAGNSSAKRERGASRVTLAPAPSAGPARVSWRSKRLGGGAGDYSHGSMRMSGSSSRPLTQSS
jgi:hypothetical protein